MTNIRGFRALRYDFETAAASPAELLAPPYDVIDSHQQNELYERHRNNIIRLILNREYDGDTVENNRYTRARRQLIDWLSDGVLHQDPRRGLYAHHQTFRDVHGQRHTRKGFLGAVRLVDYDERVVLPHERTHRGPKIDRLELMKACECNMSPVFLLYDDPDRRIDALLEAGIDDADQLDVTTAADGIRHQMWPVFNTETQREIARVLEGGQMLIADGHHRYETALAYRDFRREATREPVENAPYEYVMALMVNLHDPGLQVFSTHRAVHGLDDFDAGELLARLDSDEVFTVRELDGALADAPIGLKEQLEAAGDSKPSFIFLADDLAGPVLVQYAGDERADIFDADTPDEVRRLDVSILHEGIIARMLGISKQDQENKSHLRYIRGIDQAVSAREDDDVQLVALMNPTPVEQVSTVCTSGGKMPQKSTYFYPKVLSGLTINAL